ncbi:MAG TPA: J domain-containing protein [Acidimicrobiales bacterium]|nr:J domain-containing protein [Acidimicrobiales bacterium]
MVDHYELLGVATTATTAEIRAAFRRAANEFHPDHRDPVRDGAGGGTDHMAALNNAWWTLRDEQRRSVYDTHTSATDRPAEPAHEPDITDADSGNPTRSRHLQLLILTMALGTVVLGVMFVIAMSQSGY